MNLEESEFEFESATICQPIAETKYVNNNNEPSCVEKRNNQPFCPHCGVVVVDPMTFNNYKNFKSSKNHILALLLLLLFGIITTISAMYIPMFGLLSCSSFLGTGNDWILLLVREIRQGTRTSRIIVWIPSSSNFFSIFLSTCIFVILIFIYNTYYNTRSSSNIIINNEKDQQGQLQDALDKLTRIKESANDRNDTSYATILSQLIQCKTISYDTSLDDYDSNKNNHNNHTKNLTTQNNSSFSQQVLQFHSILETSFPHLHQKFPPTKISTFSLVYEIIPSNHPNKNTKKPILFCSHLDVVPADDKEGWLHDPFSGKIVNDFIWGRGAIDNKCNVLAQLAAIENILSSPELFSQFIHRPIFIAIGHDEEIGGHGGAATIAKYFFQQRQLSFEFILDEGNIMVSNVIPGMKGHVALIGTIEKGLMNVELSVKGLGGHASMPPISAERRKQQHGKEEEDRRIVSILLRALLALEKYPCPSHFGSTSPLRRMLEIVAQQKLVSFPMNMIFCNFWFFGPIVSRVLTRLSAGAAASIRTTTAITRIVGGEKLNSLPTKVKAYINHRIHPQDSIEKILEYDERIINNKKVSIRLLDGSRPPSKDSGYTSTGYQCIEKTVRHVFHLPSVPSLVVGNTDTYWYWNLSDQIYRFLPVAMALQDATMVHGYNERIGVKALNDLVTFYETLILLDGLDICK